MTDEQRFEQAAMREADVIVGLSALCKELISRLSQYTDMEREEQRLKEILGEDEEI